MSGLRLKTAAASAFLALAVLAQGALADDWKKLISPQELAALQKAESPLVIDIRAAAADPKKPEAPNYAAGHIPGAVSAPYARWRGPKENPGEPLTDAALTELLQSIGAETGRKTVVAHQGVDDSDFGAAARVYWTLKSAGVSQIAILNGGVAAWKAAELPLSTDPVAPERSAMTAHLSEEWMASRDEVKAVIDGEEKATLVDARPMRQYLGFAKHKAAKAAGTLPGAKRFSQAEWFDPNGALMSQPDEAAAIASSVGVSPQDTVVSFCNTGHWAATNWFALSELAGYEHVKLYPGSMVDWTEHDGKTEAPAAR